MKIDTKLRQINACSLSALRPRQLFCLEGKAAIVTGAGGGLGSWLAGGLAAAGADLLLTDRPGAPLEEVREVIAGLGSRVEAFECDLLADGAAEAIAAECAARFERVDIVVNNAGVNRRERIFDVAPESWEMIARLDLRVPFELSRAAARAMAEQGEGGAIIHIGSLNNAIGLAGVSVYGAHKAALCQLAKSMAVEWADHGIRVNAICPGFMLTPLSKPLWDDPGRGEWLLERSPMRRPGYPSELVGCCQLLASQAGSFVTGQTLYVDGGWLAGTAWPDEET